MNAWKIMSFFWIFILSVTYITHAAFTPSKEVSGTDTCSYMITWSTANWTSYSTGWNNLSCDASLSFNGMNIPDGTYNLNLKWFDKNVLWTDSAFSDGSSSNKTNKNGIKSYGPYKIDTSAPKCILKEIRFKAWESDNQYYNSGTFYYKQAADAGGQFELVIATDDTDGGTKTNVSRIKKVEFPTILGATPTTQFFDSGSLTTSWLYSWSWNQTDTFDILNNTAKRFCFDAAGNSSPLTTDASTKLIIEDGNQQVTGITSLVLVPDSSVPMVNGVALDSMTNGFSFKSWNDGLGANSSIYDGTTAKIKYFSALDNRNLIIPQFQDNGSGFRSFKVNIEKASDKNGLDVYTRTWSTRDIRSTTFADTNIIHDFSAVRLSEDNTDGYRTYGWNIRPLNLAWAEIAGWDDKICDMVGNCLSVPTPDFRVVANTPVMASNPSISDTATKGIKHNLNQAYTGNISNFSDIYTTLVHFRDQYGNEILPVSGVKEVKLTIQFDNTIGCDQLYSGNIGDCIDFSFKNGTTPLSWISASEYKTFTPTFGSVADFLWNLSIELKSAVPTKNEYKTKAWQEIYGTLSAIFQLKNLLIEVQNKLVYPGIGERPNLELAVSWNQPSYKWNPIIDFDKIADIYPLVEWQEKNMGIENTVIDNTLPMYNLEAHFGANDLLMQPKDIYLGNGHMGTKTLYDYTIFSGSTTWNGFMNYTSSDVLKFTPKVIGGVKDNIKIAFYSNLKYSIWWKDIVLPSLQTWFWNYGIHNISDFGDDAAYMWGSEVTLAEVDIRWISQTRNKQGIKVTTDNKFMDTSSITLLDLKTDIHKNVTTLLAWVDRNTGKVSGWTYTLTNLTTFPNNSTAGKNLQSGQALYFKDTDVTLDCGAVCTVLWSRTLIIENGNLFVKSDMEYANNSSVLGIILMGNKSDGNTSQLRISESVTNGVGIVYSEWPVISVTISNTEIYNGGSPSNTSLLNQLYWRGSFATRNTVGGSIKDGNGVCPYGTSDYKKSSCTIQKAQGYDLIYLRRYWRVDKSLYATIVGNPMWDGKVPINIDKKDIKIAWGDKYTISTGVKSGWSLPKPTKNNLNAPLIIEYDSQIQTNPPLWFSK